MLERRKAQRLPTFLGGIIMFSQHRGSAECIIRNRSDGGARLIVHNPSFVPDEFDLLIPQRQTTVRARTCWRGYDDLGVEFTHADFDGAASDPAAATRRIKRLECENRRLKRRLRDRTA